MDERIAGALRLLPNYLAQHVLLSASALTLGVLISLPLAVLASRYKGLRWPTLATAGLVQTIPGLALLALFYPLLLGLSQVTTAVFGVGIPALGFLPSLLALTLYSMLPILRNGVAGLTGLNPALIEAANGVGMTPRQRLLQVELPLAAPVLMAGIRTAAVWTIGAATLSTPIGQTSLGNFIFSGLQTENWVLVLVGCAAAALLALIVDQLLGLIEAGLARRQKRRLGVGLLGLGLAIAAALVPLKSQGQNTYVIGTKNFAEQFILGELVGELLERQGLGVDHKDNLGSATIFRALVSNDIDVYVDYSGTLWTNVLKRHDLLADDAMLEELTRAVRERYGALVLGRLGFENAYVLAMRADRAAALGVRTIADLATHAPQLTLGSDLEFLSRPEWTALERAYGLKFRAERSFNPTFMYRAIEEGEADVITAFSTDGRIAAQKLVVLGDPKHAILAYDAVVLLAPRRAADSRLKQILAPLIGALSTDLMREANLMVDRDTDKMSPKQAAQFLAAHLRKPAS